VAQNISSNQEMINKPGMDEKVKKIRDGDILISILMILGSSWAIYESLRMSYEVYFKGRATLYTVPGLFPFIVSLCILGGSIWVFINAIRSGGDLKFLSPCALKKTFSSFKAFIPTIVMGLMWIYVFIFVGRIHFIIATFLFISLFMITFKATQWIRILLISALYSAAIVYFFSKVVGTQFPKPLFF
jgi:hypothetical protein